MRTCMYIYTVVVYFESRGLCITYNVLVGEVTSIKHTFTDPLQSPLKMREMGLVPLFFFFLSVVFLSTFRSHAGA